MEEKTMLQEIKEKHDKVVNFMEDCHPRLSQTFMTHEDFGDLRNEILEEDVPNLIERIEELESQSKKVTVPKEVAEAISNSKEMLENDEKFEILLDTFRCIAGEETPTDFANWYVPLLDWAKDNFDSLVKALYIGYEVEETQEEEEQEDTKDLVELPKWVVEEFEYWEENWGKESVRKIWRYVLDFERPGHNYDGVVKLREFFDGELELLAKALFGGYTVKEEHQEQTIEEYLMEEHIRLKNAFSEGNLNEHGIAKIGFIQDLAEKFGFELVPF